MKLILFGASATGSEIINTLSEMPEYEILAFTDNDYSKWGTAFCDLPVISPKDAISSGHTILITASPYSSSEIVEQFEELGCHNYVAGIYSLIKKQDEALIKSIKSGSPAYIVLCEFYPHEGNIGEGGFIHRRVKSYQENGLHIDVFYLNKSELSVYEYDGVTVYTGDKDALKAVLSKNEYRKILIHFMGLDIYGSLRLIKNKLPLIVWVHGYEAERWDRRLYNYTEEELKNRAALDRVDQRKFEMLKKVYSDESIKFIFVSNWMRCVAEEDAGCNVKNHDIIHNVIDDELFNYVEKEDEQRRKILFLRSFSRKNYACDIMVKTILELSSRAVFASLEFAIYGDGALYDDTMAPLIEKSFKNVKICRGFISHEHIADLHKQYGVFLCPTRHDTQGVSMCEAMSSGLVPVTNNVSAIPEFVDENCGVLCENKNYIQMADAIENLYNDPETFKRLSLGAAERIRKQTCKSVVIPKELEIIYPKAVNQPPLPSRKNQ